MRGRKRACRASPNENGRESNHSIRLITRTHTYKRRQTLTQRPLHCGSGSDTASVADISMPLTYIHASYLDSTYHIIISNRMPKEDALSVVRSNDTAKRKLHQILNTHRNAVEREIIACRFARSAFMALFVHSRRFYFLIRIRLAIVRAVWGFSYPISHCRNMRTRV